MLRLRAASRNGRTKTRSIRLPAAYAETGDFDSAVRYAAQALAVKGIAPVDSKRIQRHLALFQQQQPIRL